MGEEIRVEAYAGHRADEAPRAFWLGARRVEVKEVLRAWIMESSDTGRRLRCFRVKGSDGAHHTLYHDERAGEWRYGGS